MLNRSSASPRAVGRILVICVAFVWSRAGFGAPPAAEAAITYEVILAAPQTQMVDIVMNVKAVEGPTLDVALPTWRPGRYEILDHAGAVREVRALDSRGRTLPIEKIRKSVWRITIDGAETLRIEYRLYANALGSRTRHVDDTHAFLSGSSVFMFAPQRMNEPLAVRISAPADWRVACGLDHAPDDPFTLIAPNYDVLVDSPIEVGLHDRIDFEAAGKPHEIVIWGEGAYEDSTLIEDFTKIIESHAAMWGDVPYERYVFLVHAGRGAGGGTEHLNSTIMQTSRQALEGSRSRSDAYRRFLGLVSHEFFHTWNVKRLRPSGIVPYDYLNENYTKLLWVAEGTTSYYDDLTLARTGLINERRYLDGLGRSIDSYRRRPGRHVQSLEESSFDAWIKFNRSSPDDVNSTVSFYSVGALVSLALDMEIRGRTGGNASLDDVLRAMYERFPLEEGGYDTDDLIDVVEELSGSSFREFFEQHIGGTVEPDLERALRVVGLELYFDAREESGDDEPGSDEDSGDESAGTESNDEEAGDDAESMEISDGDAPIEASPAVPMRADLGLNLSGSVVRSVLMDGPAYDAGLIPGDEIVALNERRIASGGLNTALEAFKPGETVMLTYFRHDELRCIPIILGGSPDGAWKVRRAKDATDEQKAAFDSWMMRPPAEEAAADDDADDDDDAGERSR